MLTLSRYKNESIIITTPEGRIEVMIQNVHRNGKVQLGIDAAKRITVHRKEIQMIIDKKEKERTNGVVT